VKEKQHEEEQKSEREGWKVGRGGMEGRMGGWKEREMVMLGQEGTDWLACIISRGRERRVEDRLLSSYILPVVGRRGGSGV